MRLDTSQQMRTDMRLRMAPRMIQSMEILQLPLMALQERIDQELSENPVLVDLRETPAPEADADETPTAPEEPASSEFDGESDGDGTVGQAEEALALGQKPDPPGVGARNLRECLLLQLTPDIPSRDTLQVLISNHLDDLQQNRLPAIEKKTGIPIEEIKEAIEH